MLGVVGSLLLAGDQRDVNSGDRGSTKILQYILAAFTFGTIACVNPWDTPVYALLLGVVLLLRKSHDLRGKPKIELLFSLGFTLLLVVSICCLGYVFYLPFYATYQQLYVNGLGFVSRGTDLNYFLTISGLWMFIVLSFFLFEFYRWWRGIWKARAKIQGKQTLLMRGSLTRWIAVYTLISAMVLIIAALLGTKVLLSLLICFGVFLFIVKLKETIFTLKPFQRVPLMLDEGGIFVAESLINNSKVQNKFVSRSSIVEAKTRFTYILLLAGLCISLGLEIVYVRDFLDGSDYERMNTVFKFSMQAWLCFAIGGAFAVQYLLSLWQGIVRKVWAIVLVLLVLGSSIFLVGGTTSRI